jgi:hypothetical protein
MAHKAPLGTDALHGRLSDDETHEPLLERAVDRIWTFLPSVPKVVIFTSAKSLMAKVAGKSIRFANVFRGYRRKDLIDI